MWFNLPEISGSDLRSRSTSWSILKLPRLDSFCYWFYKPQICFFNHCALDLKWIWWPLSVGLRLLEVVLPLPLCPLRFGLQGHPGNVHGVREGDQAGRMGVSSAFLSFRFWGKDTHPHNDVFLLVFVQFKPLEQLMGVFPAASGNFLPDTWRNLMSSPVGVCVCGWVSVSVSLSLTLNTSAAGFLHHWLLPRGFCDWSEWEEVRVARSVRGPQGLTSVCVCDSPAHHLRFFWKVLPFCRLWMSVGWERH